MIDAHPATALFPMMSDEELQGLAADIAERGLLDPVIVHEGRVLDGRNRLRACELANVEPTTREWDGSGGSPVGFVAAHNLHRRSLTKSQRAAVAAELLPMFEDEARNRQRGGTGGSRASSGAARCCATRSPRCAGGRPAKRPRGPRAGPGSSLTLPRLPRPAPIRRTVNGERAA